MTRPIRRSSARHSGGAAVEALEERRLLAATVVYRVNAGGAAITATDGGPAWAADSTTAPSPYANVAQTGNNTHWTRAAIDMTDPSVPAGTPEAVLRDDRWDAASNPELRYAFPVTPGARYTVRLYLAEIYSSITKAGQRVFSATLDGAPVLNRYDVFRDVGANKAVVKTFSTVNVDGTLDLELKHAVENPAVKGIEVLREDAAPNQLGAAVPAFVTFGAVPAAQASASKTVSIANLGGAGAPSITVTGASFSGPGAAAFTASLPAPVTLAPGQSTPVTLTFAPGQVTGAFQPTLHVHSSAATPLAVPVRAYQVAGVGAGSPVGFGKSTLANVTFSNPTSLQFGPDGKLYVAQQDGLIKVLTVARTAANQYTVTAQQTITAVKSIPNHNDNGALAPNVTTRQVTGLVVAGTAANPVVYVGSSDPRIGGGDAGTTTGLDTNSGTISRLTWTGSAWQHKLLVRGLPRSEENHSINGLAYHAASNTLYVTTGGNTNMGAPSHNFNYLPEYALTTAILAVDLTAIGETTYDLPTLDDESRPDATDPARPGAINDVNDPFGGGGGRNQAKLVPGGPVRIYAGGLRNPYDVVIASNGKMYTVDNGPNAGWGGPPVLVNGVATNQPSEPGSSQGDQLHVITGPGQYFGFPNPTRASTSNTFNATNPQSPVSAGDPRESQYVKPGQDGSLTVFPFSTNGLAEYTASNFGSALKGHLLAASFGDVVHDVALSGNGLTATSVGTLMNDDALPLDVTAQGDTGALPGTVWVATYFAGITVLEPNDFGSAGGTAASARDDVTLDEDADGFTNFDEVVAGTNPASAAETPTDTNGDLTSDVLDDDDDGDHVPDARDPFAIDPADGRDTPLPVVFDWSNEGAGDGGFFGLGFTGLMRNGRTDYRDQFDAGGVTARGAAGVFTVDNIGPGTAVGAANSQRYAFQLGVDATTAGGPFTLHTRVLAPFVGTGFTADQNLGFYFGTGDQDNFVQLVVTGDRRVMLRKEVAGATAAPQSVSLGQLPADQVDLFLDVDPAKLTVTASFAATSGDTTAARRIVGTTAFPLAWLTAAAAPAVGLIGTTASGPAFSASWDFLYVTPTDPNLPPVVSAGADQVITLPDPVTLAGTASDDGKPSGTLTATWSQTSGPGTATFADPASPATAATFSAPGTYVLTLSGTDGELESSSTVTVTVNPAPQEENQPPIVTAGTDQTIVLPAAATLTGSASDDGRPSAALTTTWSMASGPGTVTFANPSAAETTATFSAAGTYVLTLTADDGALQSASSVTVTVTGGQSQNRAPVVNAGADQSVTLPASATLSGSASDDGLPTGALTTAWSQTSGPGTATFTDPAAASTTASFSVAGTYVLTLTASDGELQAADSVTVTVAPAATANRPPVVTAGANQIVTLPGTAALAGTASDDGKPSGVLTTAWTKTSGPGTVTFADAAAQSTTASFSAAGTYVLALTATDGELQTTSSLTVTVNPAAPAGNGAPFGGTAWAVPGKIEAENFNDGGQGVAYHDVDPANNGGKYRTNVGVDIESTTDAGGGFNVGWVKAGEFLAYTVNVATAGDYQFDVRLAAASGGGTFHVEVGGVDRTGPVTVAATGGWQAYVTRALQLTGLAAGSQVMKIVFDTNGTAGFVANVNWYALSAATPQPNQPPVVSAGPNQTITLPAGATLSGSATDDGKPSNTLTTAWTKASGPGTVTFANPAAAATTATFSVAGTYVLTLTASDGQLSASSSLTVTVNPASTYAGTPFGGVARAVPGTIQAEDFDDGGASVAFQDADPANNGGKYRTNVGVDIESTTDAGGGFNVGWVKAGEWLSYTVDVAATGNYRLDARVAATGTGGRFHVEIDGVDKTGPITVPSTGAWQTYQTVSVPVTNLTAGRHVMRVVFDANGTSGSVANVNWFALASTGTAPTNQPPVVNAGADAPVTLPNAATLNGSVSDDGLPAGGALSSAWTKASGPGTVTFANPAAAATTATFSAAGTYVLTLTATDGALTTADSVTITVSPAQATPAVTALVLVNADTGQPIAGFDPIANGATIDLAALPTRRISVRATTSPATVGSVKFGYDANPTYRIESSAPYSLAGDSGGVYTPWTPTVGGHTLTATPYAQANAGGAAGTALTVTFTVTDSAAPAAPNTFAWNAIAPAPTARSEGVAATVGGKLYAFGGFYNGAFQATARSDVYDPATNAWTRTADMPEVLTHAASAVDGSTVWVVGGFVGNSPGPQTNHVWRFDASNPTTPWSAAPNLPAAVGAGAAAVVGRELHFVGGLTRSATGTPTANLNAHYVLNLDNPAAGWTSQAALPTARNHLAAAAVGTKLYAIGGQTLQNEETGNFATVEVYDIVTDTWSPAAPLPAGRGHMLGSTFVADGRIVVIGGITNNSGGADPGALVYDPAANVWAALKSLPSGRASPFAGLVGNTIVVAGGHAPGAPQASGWSTPFRGTWETAAALPVALGEVTAGAIGTKLYVVGEGSASTYVYDLALGRWETTTAATRPFVGHHHSAEVYNGKWYLIGGLHSGAGKVQVYDPATNQWTAGADMPYAGGSVSTALIGGKIYAAGGIVGAATVTTAAVYDIATNAWTPIAAMPLGVNHAAATTDGTRFYVMGGRGGGNTPSNGFDAVQIYNPVTNAWQSSTIAGSTVAPLPQARGGMGKAVYYKGEIYVFGGETSTGAGATSAGVYNRVDAYNPVTNTWRLAPAMPTARHGIFPVLTAGRIYLAGGGVKAANSQSIILEIFNP